MQARDTKMTAPELSRRLAIDIEGHSAAERGEYMGELAEFICCSLRGAPPDPESMGRGGGYWDPTL